MTKWSIFILVFGIFNLSFAQSANERLWETIKSDTFPYQLRYEFEEVIAHEMLKELSSISPTHSDEYNDALKTVIIFQSLVGNTKTIDSLIQIKIDEKSPIVNELIATKLYLEWLPCAQSSEGNECTTKRYALRDFLKNNFITAEPNEAMRWHWTAKMLNDSSLIARESKNFVPTPQLFQEDQQPSYPGAILAVNRTPTSNNILISNGYRFPIELLEQNKKGEWINVTKTAQLDSIPGGDKIYAIDINNNGFQDILILRNLTSSNNYLFPSLLINQGDGTYKDMSKEAGFDTPQRSTCACFIDANEDGQLDIFLGNEKYPSLLFIQQEDGSFKESAKSYGLVTHPHSIVDCAVYDINQDGKNDLLLSSYHYTNFSYIFKNINNQYPFFINTTNDTKYFNPYKGGKYFIGDFNGDQSIEIISNTDHSLFDKNVVFNILSGTSGSDEYPAMWQLDKFNKANMVEQHPLLTYARAAVNIDLGENRPYILFGGGRQLDELYPTTFYQFKDNHYFFELLSLKDQPLMINSMTVTPSPKTQQPVIWIKGGFPNSILKNKIATYSQTTQGGNFFTIRLHGQDRKDGLGALITVVTVDKNGKETRRTRLIQAVSSDGKGAGQDIWFLAHESTIKEIIVKWPNRKQQHFQKVNLKRKRMQIDLVAD